MRKRELLHLPQLDLRSSEIHGIIGESGSGKSLFLFSLMGLLSRGLYASGEAIFETSGSAQNLLECPEQRFRQIRGKQIGMVFQEPMSALNPRVKCGPQIEEVLQVHKVGLANAGSTVLEALEQSGLEEPLRIYHSYPHQISGGQRQRVMVAMATILKPALVLADEPTTALDPETGNAVLKTLVDRCRENRSSLILVSHDLKSIATWADSISVLRNGKCLAQGETEHVLQSGVVPYVQELLDASKVERHKTALQEPKTFVVNGLSKTYRAKGKELPVLKTVNVALAAGETLAIVGKSGSGKSTLAKILTGLEKADAGSVSFHGENILLRKNTGVQMVFQDPYSSLNNEMTCGGAVMEVLHLRGFNKTESESQARELFGLVGLSADQLSYYPHQLSGGQRQRVCIARALAAEPEVLILDESVAALDPIVQKQVLLLLADIQDNKKLIYLFITHNPEVAAYFAHSVVKIEAGVATQTQNSV